MRRWLVLILGLAMVAGALYVLAADGGRGRPDEIDDASRARMQHVLREAERKTPQ